MERKFKITIGEKTLVVTVEEISEAAAGVTPPTVKPPVEEKPLEAAPVKEVAPRTGPDLGGEGVVRAPMSGVILSIKHRVNDKVNTGDPLLTLEAMKMENVIYAPRSGVIKRIGVSERQSVSYGDVLLVID